MSISTDRSDWSSLGGIVAFLAFLAVLVYAAVSTGGFVAFIAYAMVGVWGLYMLYDGFTRWRTVRLVEDTAPEPVRSVAVGQTEVRGTAEPVDEPVPRPFSDGDCVLAYWEVEEYDDDWETVASGVRHVPFAVDDGTGAVRVEPPEDATTRMSDRNTAEITTGAAKYWGRGGEPEPVREFLASHPEVGMPDEGVLTRRQRRYTESVVPPGEEVYVFGGASVAGSEGSNPERLVLSADGATGRFIVSDRPAAFAEVDRSWALTEVAIGLAMLLLVVVLVLLFGGA